MEEKKQNDNYQKVIKLLSIQAITGIVIGILTGYLYYIKVGCTSGTCPITSSPWMSMLMGGIIGYLLGDVFTKKKTKEDK